MNNSKKISINGLIAAIYVLSTLLTSQISFGVVQFRPGEALAILPLVIPSSWIGLTVGCLIANLLSVGGIFDVIIGSVLTLISSLITAYIGKTVKKEIPKVILGCISPILFNALGIPFVLYLAKILPNYSLLAVATVAASECISVCAIGIPIYFLRKRIITKR